MNTRVATVRTVIAALALVAAFPAGATPQQPDPPPAGGTMGKVASSAEAELNASIAELAKVRAAVASEKLPLAQQLTSLEEGVIGLRKEADRVQRLVDAGALEIGTLKAEIKSREDELGYITSLLDEYGSAPRRCSSSPSRSRPPSRPSRTRR